MVLSNSCRGNEASLKNNFKKLKKLLTDPHNSGIIPTVAAETQKQRSLRDTGSQGIIQTIRGRNQKDEKST